jgi:hypothetical protein
MNTPDQWSGLIIAVVACIGAVTAWLKANAAHKRLDAAQVIPAKPDKPA